MILLLVLLTCALLGLGAILGMRAPSGFDWAFSSLMAAPWLIGLLMLAVKRPLGIAVLQASSALYALVLLYPTFLSIAFLDGSLRSRSTPLFFLDCLLILAAATAARRKTDAPLSGVAMAAAWMLPVMLGLAARGLIQTRGAQEDRKVLATMDFNTGDEARRLADCLERFFAANGQRYPADAAALQQHCAGELRLSYYQVEYIVPAGAADYSMCLTPRPASAKPNSIPWILVASGTLIPAQSHPGSACGYTSANPVRSDGVAAAAHQCLLRRQVRGDLATAPGFSDIWQGDGCLAFDSPQVVKATATEMTLPTGRLLLLPSDRGSPYRPRFLHCDRQPDYSPPSLWTSRSTFQPAPASLAKLCAPQQQ